MRVRSLPLCSLLAPEVGSLGGQRSNSLLRARLLGAPARARSLEASALGRGVRNGLPGRGGSQASGRGAVENAEPISRPARTVPPPEGVPLRAFEPPPLLPPFFRSPLLLPACAMTKADGTTRPCPPRHCLGEVLAPPAISRCAAGGSTEARRAAAPHLGCDPFSAGFALDSGRIFVTQ